MPKVTQLEAAELDADPGSPVRTPPSRLCTWRPGRAGSRALRSPQLHPGPPVRKEQGQVGGGTRRMPLSGDGGDEMGSRGDTEGEGLLTRGTFHEGPDLDPRPGGVSGGRAGPQTPPPPSPLEPGGLLRAVPPKLQAGLGARWEAAGLTSAGAGQTGRGSRARGRVVPVPRPPPPRPPRPQEAGGRTAGSQASVSTDRRAEAAAGPQRMSTSWRQPGPQPPSAATLRSAQLRLADSGDSQSHTWGPGATGTLCPSVTQRDGHDSWWQARGSAVPGVASRPHGAVRRQNRGGGPLLFPCPAA